MEAGGPVDVAATQAAMNQLAAHLGELEFRNSFVADPYAAIEATEVDAEALPPGLIDMLGGMSHDQLELISTVQPELAGSVADLPDWAKVCIFF
jgi:hypothetical protein